MLYDGTAHGDVGRLRAHVWGQASSPPRATEGPWDGVVSWSMVKTRTRAEVEGSRCCPRNCAQARRKQERDIPGFLFFLFSRVLVLKPAKKPEGKRAQVIPLAGSIFWTGQTRMENGLGAEGQVQNPYWRASIASRTLQGPRPRWC